MWRRWRRRWRRTRRITERFKGGLVQPGLRIPLMVEAGLFEEAVGLGREVVWLHTFGERFADEKAGRPAGAPRVGAELAPRVPKGGAIPGGAEEMPDEMGWDEAGGALEGSAVREAVGERGAGKKGKGRGVREEGAGLFGGGED